MCNWTKGQTVMETHGENKERTKDGDNGQGQEKTFWTTEVQRVSGESEGGLNSNLTR